MGLIIIMECMVMKIKPISFLRSQFSSHMETNNIFFCYRTSVVSSLVEVVRDSSFVRSSWDLWTSNEGGVRVIPIIKILWIWILLVRWGRFISSNLARPYGGTILLHSFLIFFFGLMLVRSTFLGANILLYMLEKFSISSKKLLIQRISKSEILESSLHGQNGHGFIEVADLQYGGIEVHHIISQWLPLLLFDGEEVVRILWHSSISTKVSHE